MKKVATKSTPITVGDSFSTYQYPTTETLELPVYKTECGQIVSPVKVLTLHHNQNSRIIWDIPKEIEQSAPFESVDVYQEGSQIIARGYRPDGLSRSCDAALYDEVEGRWGEPFNVY